MLSDFKPVEQLSAIRQQAMEQARGVVDTYFEFLKKTVSSSPSGGTEFGEKLKRYSEQNIAATHEFMKQLTQAKEFEEMVRIQSEFMQTLLKAFGEQAKSLGEAYTKTATATAKTPFKTP